MIWGKLATWLYTTATADNGASGLFYSTSPLVTGWYTNEAPQNAAMPYVVASVVSQPEYDALSTTPETIFVRFQIGVYTDKDSGQLVHDAITDRIRTLFRRVAPTITGWTCGQISVADGTVFNTTSERSLYSVIEARCLIAK